MRASILATRRSRTRIEDEDQASDVGARVGIGRLLQAGLLLLAHLHELAAARRLRLDGATRRRQRLGRRRTEAGAQLAEHPRVHPVGLADHPHRPGEVARLTRVHAAEARPGRLERLAQDAIVSAARLEDDPCALAGTGLGQGARRGGAVVDPARAAAGMTDVEPVLGDVDADEDLLRHDPCSCPAGYASASPINCSG
jgi:hypothetical protein